MHQFFTRGKMVGGKAKMKRQIINRSALIVNALAKKTPAVNAGVNYKKD